jgi:hypothetical protein
MYLLEIRTYGWNIYWYVSINNIGKYIKLDMSIIGANSAANQH